MFGARAGGPEPAEVPRDEPHPSELDLARLRPAAVLVAVFDASTVPVEAHVVLTRRAPTLRSHSHQVAFPGGRIDRGESAWDAARREAFEEVGIPMAAPRVVRALPALATLAGGSAVEPFLAVLGGPPALVANPAEVERAFTVSLADLVADGCHHEERWDFPDLPDRAIHFFDLPEDVVWGATARILFALLVRLLGLADPAD